MAAAALKEEPTIIEELEYVPEEERIYFQMDKCQRLARG